MSHSYTPNNPFLIYGYAGPDYFCDRQQETEQLVAALQNGRNVTLISPRRMGKTGLIHHVFHHLRQQKDAEIVTVYIDIFSTRNLRELVNLLGRALLEASQSRWDSIVQQMGQWLKHCRPVLSVDSLTGAPSLSLVMEAGQEEPTLNDLFRYMASLDREIYIAIDEFQQITQYAERGTEALLRSEIQFVPQAHFIFSGSSKHLMTEMFASSKRPFYQSTQVMEIGTIGREVYREWASRTFTANRCTLEAEAFDHLYATFEGHTWYVQSVLNRLYQRAHSISTASEVDQCIQQILEEQTTTYQTMLSLLPDRQVDLLKAIAQEGSVSNPTKGDFIARHRLKAASSVTAALKSLTEKEVVYQAPDSYSVYDRFLSLWLRRGM